MTFELLEMINTLSQMMKQKGEGGILVFRLFLVLVLASTIVIFCVLSINHKVVHEEPLEFLGTSKNITTCGSFPSPDEISRDNVWQVLKIGKDSVRFLNAYLDTRKGRKLVRINANGIQLDKIKIYCQFFYDDFNPPDIVESSGFIPMWNQSEKQHFTRPYMITCPLGKVKNRTGVPRSVSLAAHACDYAKNNLNIINNQPIDGKKKEFGVCSYQVILTIEQAFVDENFLIRYMEWMHLLNILGADKIYMYKNELEPDIHRIMNFYEVKEIIEMWQFSTPIGSSPDEFPNDLLEMNMINDCFYRIMNLYEHILILSYVEAVIPVKKSEITWHDLLQNNVNVTDKHDLYSSQSVYYRDLGAPSPDIPRVHHMLHHIQRGKSLTSSATHLKSIINPNNVIMVSDHSSFLCFDGPCYVHHFPANISQNSYYRVPEEGLEYEDTVKDETIWKYKAELIKRMKDTLDELHIDV